MTLEGMVSKKNKRGKNTTTMTTLYKIDTNSYIADTPGFMGLDIDEISTTNLYKYFIDLYKYANSCEFADCSHIKETKCGIKKALEEGKIFKERYDRYCIIYNELKEKEKRKWQ